MGFNEAAGGDPVDEFEDVIATVGFRHPEVGEWRVPESGTSRCPMGQPERQAEDFRSGVAGVGPRPYCTEGNGTAAFKIYGGNGLHLGGPAPLPVIPRHSGQRDLPNLPGRVILNPHLD